MHAQQTHAPALQVSARLVVLDVVIKDAKGQPVNDVKRNELQVYEDGVLQNVRSFEPPSAHRMPSADAKMPAARLDMANPASFGQSPVTILVLDQTNTHFADSSFARRSLHDYLARQPQTLGQPTTLLAVQDTGFKELAPVTLNRDALQHALQAAPVAYDWRLEENGEADQGPIERLDKSLRALEQITQSFARIPGHKSIVWVGGGFPSIDPRTLDSGEVNAINETLRHITNLMLADRVALYAVDPTSRAPGLTEITDQDQAAFAMAAGDSLSLNAGTMNGDEDFDKLSTVTGGTVVRGKNNVAEQIANAIDTGSDFYTLSYTPTSTSDKPSGVRKIKVVCLRPGLTATTRTEYYTREASPAEAADNAAYDLNTAAESAVPLTGLHITVVPDGAHGYLVHVRAADLKWKAAEDGASTSAVILMAVALDAKGKAIARTLRGMDAVAPAGTDLQAPARSADFVLSPDVPAKTRSLRFVVRDPASGLMGTAEVPVQKPAP